MSTVLKTRAQVKKEFSRQGLTVIGWANKHGFSRATVYRVMSGRSLNLYGNSHKIAVLLGIKDGIITDD